MQKIVNNKKKTLAWFSQILKLTQAEWKTDFLLFDQIGYNLFQNILAALYIVCIGLLLFNLYEMHLVELRCSKSASL